MTAILFKVLDYQAGTELPLHCHEDGQILFARSGSMEVRAGNQVVMIPSTRIAWVPAGMQHSIRFRSDTKMRTAFIRPEAVCNDFNNLHVFQITSLFRELLIKLVEDDKCEQDYRGLLERALIKELSLLREEPFSIPLPVDARAKRVAEALCEEPSNTNNIADWAQIAACSSKTLGRLFLKDTGQTFQLWRRHMRLLAALHYLDDGLSVTETAHAVGFSSSSSFAEAHRITFGFPPTGAKSVS